MRSLPSLPAAVLAGAVALAGLTAATVPSASAAEPARPIVALSANGLSLVQSTIGAPGTTTTVPIVAAGLGAGETLVGLAFRPANGVLYTLGVNSAADYATLYTVVPATGVLTRVGAANGLVRWTSDGVTAVDLTDPATTGYGIDINPTVDRIRIVATTGLNARINPNDGAPVDGNSGGGIGTNPDNSSALMATASYTNAQAATGGVTTEYALLPNENTLAIINLPNDGTATLPKEVLLGGVGLDFTSLAGLDIPSDVRVATSNTAATGTAYAVLTVAGTTGTYSIDLATGAATLLAPSAVALRAIAVGEVPAATPAPVVAPATVTKAGKAKVKGSKVTLPVTVACPTGGAACPVKVTLKTQGKKSKSIAKGYSATVAPGSAVTVKVNLNKRGKKLLKAGKVKAVIAVTTTSGPDRTPATTTTKTVLKKKQAKRRP